MPPGNEERGSTVPVYDPRDGDPLSPPLLEGSFHRRPESQDRRRALGSGGGPGPTSTPSPRASEEISRAPVSRHQPSRAPVALRRICLVRRHLPAGCRETESRRSQRGLPRRKLPASPPLHRRIISLPRQSAHSFTKARNALPQSSCIQRAGFARLSGSQQAGISRFFFSVAGDRTLISEKPDSSPSLWPPGRRR